VFTHPSTSTKYKDHFTTAYGCCEAKPSYIFVSVYILLYVIGAMSFVPFSLYLLLDPKLYDCISYLWNAGSFTLKEDLKALTKLHRHRKGYYIILLPMVIVSVLTGNLLPIMAPLLIVLYASVDKYTIATTVMEKNLKVTRTYCVSR